MPGGSLNKLMTSLGIALAVTTAASGLGLGSVAHADDIRFPPRVIVVQSGGEFRIQLHNDESIDGTTTLRVRPKGGQTVAAEVGVGTWKCVATEDDHCFSSVAESAPVVLDEMGMYDLDIVLHKGAEDETVHRKDAWGFAYALNPGSPRWCPVLRCSPTSGAAGRPPAPWWPSTPVPTR